jgi:hypothetical protein
VRLEVYYAMLSEASEQAEVLTAVWCAKCLLECLRSSTSVGDHVFVVSSRLQVGQVSRSASTSGRCRIDICANGAVHWRYYVLSSPPYTSCASSDLSRFTPRGLCSVTLDEIGGSTAIYHQC